jgi:hypothetical protein
MLALALVTAGSGDEPADQLVFHEATGLLVLPRRQERRIDAFLELPPNPLAAEVTEPL